MREEKAKDQEQELPDTDAREKNQDKNGAGEINNESECKKGCETNA